jgi:hypothetical protein
MEFRIRQKISEAIVEKEILRVPSIFSTLRSEK